MMSGFATSACSVPRMPRNSPRRVYRASHRRAQGGVLELGATCSGLRPPSVGIERLQGPSPPAWRAARSRLRYWTATEPGCHPEACCCSQAAPRYGTRVPVTNSRFERITSKHPADAFSDVWGALNKTGVLREVLLGKPDYYRWYPTSAISKATLANLKTRGLASILNTRGAQYAEMVSICEDAGVRVHLLRADEQAPYGVFARDSSVYDPAAARDPQRPAPIRRRDHGGAAEVFHVGGTQHPAGWKRVRPVAGKQRGAKRQARYNRLAGQYCRLVDVHRWRRRRRSPLPVDGDSKGGLTRTPPSRHPTDGGSRIRVPNAVGCQDALVAREKGGIVSQTHFARTHEVSATCVEKGWLALGVIMTS